MNDMRKLFKSLLEDEKVSINDITSKKEWRIPTKIYRYMRFDDYWTNNLFKGEVVLSKPKDFNDPFDCYLNIDIKKFWDMSGKEMFLKEYNMNINMDDNFEKYAMESINFAQDKARVTCFAESWKTLLLWSHYADSHKGLCIEYDTSLMGNLRNFLFPVIYQDELYDATKDFCTNNENLFNFLFFKSEEWKYENEWRIAVIEEQLSKLLYDKESKRYKYNLKDCISAVYIGLKADDNKIEQIKNAGKDFKIYKTKLSSTKFILEKEEM